MLVPQGTSVLRPSLDELDSYVQKYTYANKYGCLILRPSLYMEDDHTD